MKKYLLLGGMLALALSLAMPTTTYARRGADDPADHDINDDRGMHSGDDSVSDQNDDSDDDSIRKAEKEQKRCEKIERKINRRITRLGAKDMRQFSSFESLETRLATFSSNAKTAGLDTTDLDAVLAELSKKIDAYQASYQKYLDAVKNAGAVSCTDGSSKFKEGLKIAKSVIKEVKTAGAEVRKYFRDSVRPEIRDLVEQSDGSLSFKSEKGL